MRADLMLFAAHLPPHLLMGVPTASPCPTRSDTQGGVSSSGMNGMLAGPQDDVNEFRARIEALANFKTFMQVSHQLKALSSRGQHCSTCNTLARCS